MVDEPGKFVLCTFAFKRVQKPKNHQAAEFLHSQMAKFMGN